MINQSLKGLSTKEANEKLNTYGLSHLMRILRKHGQKVIGKEFIH